MFGTGPALHSLYTTGIGKAVAAAQAALQPVTCWVHLATSSLKIPELPQPLRLPETLKMLELLQTMALIDDSGAVLTVYVPSSSYSPVAAAASYCWSPWTNGQLTLLSYQLMKRGKKRESIEHPARESTPNNNSSSKLPELPKLLFVPSRSDPPGPGQGGRNQIRLKLA